MPAEDTDDHSTAESAAGRQDTITVLGRYALIITGLSGLAVTQPVLGLFGDNPEFFVAGNYTTTQIVVYALLVAFVPATVGIAVTSIAVLVGRRAGSAVFAAVVAVLAAAAVMGWLRALGVDGIVVIAPVAVAAAAGITYVVVTKRAAQQFFAFLAVANLVFVGIFLFTSRASELVVGGQPVVAVDDTGTNNLRGPLVVVALDEFPAATIMRGDGTINADRYPGFAELAGASTWFRNASGADLETQRALPPILTGKRTTPGALPTFRDHPRNLFTTLGAQVPASRFEATTVMCPPEICEPEPPSPLRQALSDTSIVYGHRVLPTELGDRLPAIDGSWGDFGGGVVSGSAEEPDSEELLTVRVWAMGEDEKGPLAQASQMARQVEAIDGSPAVHFVHVLLPHYPWTVSPTGTSTRVVPWIDVVNEDPDTPGHDFRLRLQQQLHAMQVGFVDTLVGDLVERLQSLPSWDDTMLVVTSDHGISFTPPDLGRKSITPSNREEVLRVPLFVKVPGQRDGEIRDDSAQTIDVMPSIADVLDVEVDGGWDFDGHSLFDGSEAHTEPLVSTDVGEVLAIAERRGDQFPSGDDWIGLAAVGEQGDLVGRPVDSFDIGAPSDLAAEVDGEETFADLPAGGQVPIVLSGTVATAGGRSPPPELLVAVNGTTAGVVGGYRRQGDRWAFLGYVADRYRPGANTVELFEVERTDEAAVLHPVE